MRRVSRKVLMTIAFLVVAMAVWSKISFNIFIRMSIWEAIIFFGLAVGAIFLAFDHFLNRRRNNDVWRE